MNGSLKNVRATPSLAFLKGTAPILSGAAPPPRRLEELGSACRDHAEPDLEPVAVLVPLREQLENGVVLGGAALDAEPLDVGVEHVRERIEVACDEGVVALQNAFDVLAAHRASAERWRPGTPRGPS